MKYNPTDEMLLEKAKVEIKNYLRKARTHLYLSDDGQEMDPTAAFAAVLPRQFLESFHKYLKTSVRNRESPTWIFSDIITFLRCEVLMRLYCASATELEDYDVDHDEITKFKTPKKADKPPSKRKVVDGGDVMDGTHWIYSL